MNSASNNQGPDSESDVKNEDIMQDMSSELKQLVLSWVPRLDSMSVSADVAVDMMIAVLEAGLESIVRVCEGISGGTAS